MRRWFPVAVLTLLLLALPVFAQRGGRGGAAMGGAHGSGGASHGGGYAPAHGGSYGHPSNGYGNSSNGYSHRPYYPGHYPYRPYYPWGWGYGYVGYPGAWWGYYGGVGLYSGYLDTPPSTPTYVYTTPDTTSSYVTAEQQQQIDQLNQEVANLRAQQGYPPPQQYAPPPSTQVHAQTVLVFRDHHTEEITNYAVVGTTLWIFTEQRARKIPVAQLDVPATTKANEDRGIVFSLPTE